MRKAKVYLLGSLSVAGVGIVLRFAQTGYNVYIAGKMGPEGIGLLTLILSVYGLAVTFASSGVYLTCTRMVSEALALNNKKEATRSLGGCIVYSLFFGLLSALLLFILAKPLGMGALGSARAEKCLRALCPALPAASLSSCFSGCFAAMRKAYKSSLSEVVKEVARFLFTAFFFAFFYAQGKEIEAVLYAALASEMLSFLLLLLFLLVDARTARAREGNSLPHLAKRICSISLPIALASWARSALVTAEHILIPKGLRRFGDKSALATYGIMHGMALPIVFLPYAVLTPFTQLLVPEFARFKAADSRKDVVFSASLVLRMTMLFAFGCSAFLCAFGEEIGDFLYHTEGVGKMTALFALLIPVMYLDTAVDAILKGLGEQFYCMIVNLLDAGLSLLLVTLLVPRIGAQGYLLTVFISECFNTSFSFLRLYKKARVPFSPFHSLVLPALCAFSSGWLAKKVFDLAAFSIAPRFICSTIVFLALYAAFLCLSGAFGKSDRHYFKRLIKNA